MEEYFTGDEDLYPVGFMSVVVGDLKVGDSVRIVGESYTDRTGYIKSIERFEGYDPIEVVMDGLAESVAKYPGQYGRLFRTDELVLIDESEREIV